MTEPAAQYDHTEPTHQNGHPATQHSHASTDTSNFHQRPTFKTRNTHLCITIRWPAKAEQTRQPKVILKGDPAGDVEMHQVGGLC